MFQTTNQYVKLPEDIIHSKPPFNPMFSSLKASGWAGDWTPWLSRMVTRSDCFCSLINPNNSFVTYYHVLIQPLKSGNWTLYQGHILYSLHEFRDFSGKSQQFQCPGAFTFSWFKWPQRRPQVPCRMPPPWLVMLGASRAKVMGKMAMKTYGEFLK